MKDGFFWSPRDAEFTGWLANFIKFVTTYATLIGFTQADLDWLNNLYKAVSFADKVASESKKLWMDFVAARNAIIRGDSSNAALPSVIWPTFPDFGQAPAAVAPDAMNKIASYVRIVANSTSLTREQKIEAGVTSKPRTKPDPNNVTPALKVTVVNGQAVLDCPLNGFKGYAVFVDDGDGVVNRISNSTSRRYVDSRPLPTGVNTQKRSYFVQYIWNENELVGEYSNAVTVAVMRYV